VEDLVKVNPESSSSLESSNQQDLQVIMQSGKEE